MGIIGNSEKVSCAEAASVAADLILAAGRKLYSDTVTARLAKLKGRVCRNAAELARNVDLLLVLGGDGTILRVAREIAGRATPILGINIGSLGFLTAVPSNELPEAMRAVWLGQFEIETRALLQATGRSKLGVISQTALNDIVVTRGIASRLIELDVRVDGDSLTRYRCDGLIVSSATGSTAYSLAAGGAVVFPTADVVALTPICPQALSNRSLILPASSAIEVTVISHRPETILSADGQLVSTLATGDVVTVRRSKQAVRLLRLSGSTFCDTLRRKLQWRGTPLA